MLETSQILNRLTESATLKMAQLSRELKAQEKILSQNKDSYLSIKKSLVKALISKKQRI